MSKKTLLIASRCAAIAAFGVMTALPLCAQQSGLNPASSPLLMASAKGAAASSDIAGDGSSSSALTMAWTPADADAAFKESAVGDEAMQPPPRRRYGRPTYHDANSNPDGSRKWTFMAGGGFGLPEGTNSNYMTTGYGLDFGGGRNFSEHLGLLLRIAYDHFGMTGTTITNQSILYFNDPTNANGLGGNNHIWSASIDPVFNLAGAGRSGLYVTGGVGFYHKVANFTLPETGESCDIYYGCYEFTENANVDHYTSNAVGYDGGVGYAYRLSRFASEQLFAEVRYVYINNQYKPGVTQANVSTYTGYNYFPQNSLTTSYLPVRFGIRW